MASEGRTARPMSVNDRRASMAMRQSQTRSTGTPDDRSHRQEMAPTGQTATRTKTLDHAAGLRIQKPVPAAHRSDGRTSRAEPIRLDSPEPQSRKVESHWQPTATLLSPTEGHAPLASRISVPPQAKHAPTSLAGPSLANLSLVAQEAAMIDDLLYNLLGLEGQYITFGQDRQPYEPFDERSRLVGPSFQIARGLDPSLRDLTYQVLTTATHVAALEAFVEIMSRESRGSVSHALAAAIRKIQKDFMILVAQLENQYLTNEAFTLHQLSLHLRKSAHMLSLLYSLAQEILAENGLIGSPEEDKSEDEDDENEFENVLATLNGHAASRKKSCIGGTLLNLIHKRHQTLAGDPQAHELFKSLHKAASVPYIRMLNEWLHHGNVKDSHLEFMINETKSHNREKLAEDYTDDYWEKRYTIREGQVPQSLAMISDKILLAGKYLNVVRECSSSESSTTDLSNAKALSQDIYDTTLIPSVSTAYYHANAELMRLLLTTHHLSRRLRSLKHWFFLDRSDWFTHFLESTQSELRKHAKAANIDKLRAQFDIILHEPGSNAAEELFGDDVRVIFAESALTVWLRRIVNVQGMDSDATALANAYTPAGTTNGKDEEDLRVHQVLSLDTTVPFPISLIISRVTLTRYQVLFRYLMSIKYLEFQLFTCWTEAGGVGSVPRKSDGPKLQYSDVNVWRRRTGNKKVEQWKRRSWRLRSRMLIFVQQLLYYCTNEVIEPRWEKFMNGYGMGEGTTKDRPSTASTESMAKRSERTVDELMQGHVDFLGSCLQDCMLTNDKLLRINAKVTSTCSHMASFAGSFTRSLDRVAPAGSTEINEEEFAKLSNILTQYEQHFERHLKLLLEALNYLAATENASFLVLCARLSIALEGGAGGRAGPGSVEDVDMA